MQSAWLFKGCWDKIWLNAQFPSQSLTSLASCTRSKPLTLQNIRRQTVILNEFPKSVNKILNSYSREWVECNDLCPEETLAECTQRSKLEKHTHLLQTRHTHTTCGYFSTHKDTPILFSLPLLPLSVLPSCLSLSLSLLSTTSRIATLSTAYQIWSYLRWPEWMKAADIFLQLFLLLMFQTLVSQLFVLSGIYLPTVSNAF